MNFRARDRVSVEGTVKAYPGDYVLIEINGVDPTVVVKVTADKVKLLHQHFEVGDRVYSADDSEVSGTVVAIDGTVMWMRTERGADHFLRLSEVRQDDDLGEQS